MDHLGEKILALIYKRKSSQKITAKGIGVDESTLSRWISMPIPPLKGIISVCEYYGEPLSRFFGAADGIPYGIDAEILDIISAWPEEKKKALVEFIKHR